MYFHCVNACTSWDRGRYAKSEIFVDSENLRKDEERKDGEEHCHEYGIIVHLWDDKL